MNEWCLEEGRYILPIRSTRKAMVLQLGAGPQSELFGSAHDVGMLYTFLHIWNSQSYGEPIIAMSMDQPPHFRARPVYSTNSFMELPYGFHSIGLF